MCKGLRVSDTKPAPGLSDPLIRLGALDDEQAVVSLAAWHDGNAWRLRFGSLIIGPSDMARLSWREWFESDGLRDPWPGMADLSLPQANMPHAIYGWPYRLSGLLSDDRLLTQPIGGLSGTHRQEGSPSLTACGSTPNARSHHPVNYSVKAIVVVRPWRPTSDLVHRSIAPIIYIM